MNLRFAHLLLLTLVGCVGSQPILQTLSPAVTPAAARPTAPPDSRGTPAREQLYTPDEAVRDALSSPLELVGVGGWRDLFRRVSCVYRNNRVFVVDVQCGRSDDQPISVLVYSPGRGRVGIHASGKAPLAALKRADYENFTLESSPLHAAPSALALSMSYEEVAAYENARHPYTPPGCLTSKSRPQGTCQGLATTAAEFASRNASFLENPPDGWYQLLRTLIAERERSHASVIPGALPASRLTDWGASWARDNELSVHEESLKQVGNTEGFFAPILATPDRGALLVGLREIGHFPDGGGKDVPVVMRLDATGKKVWEQSLPYKTFVDFETTSAVATPDGFVIYTVGYFDRAWKPIHRLVKLDSHGKVLWQWLANGRDRIKIPQPETVQLTPRGTFLLKGHIQLEKDGVVRDWTGEVNASGKAIRDEVGAPQTRP